jgi:type VI secretion system protein ImpL
MQEAAARMAQDGGPWFALLNRITTELEPLATGGELPPWLAQLLQFQLIRAQGFAQESGTLSKAAESGKQLLATVEKKIGRDVGAKKLEQHMAAAQAFGAYKTSLAAIAPAAASRNQAYQLTAQVFSEDPVTSKSPFYTGYAALEKLKNGIGDGKAPEETVGRLLSGPLDYLWGFVCQETAAHLEGQWNEQVLAPVSGMSSREAAPLLVGTDGLVWKFVKGPAAPFLSRNPRSGYYAKEALGATIPLDKALFAFLNKGAKAQVEAQVKAQTKQQNYTLGIRGLPTEANTDAKLQPHGTRLELHCGASMQSIANYNYPVHKTFNWSPDSCGDVILQIEVSDMVLTKRYMGPQAFPEFLKNFQGGQRTLSLNEFPGERAALGRLRIKWIKVHYQFFGSGPIIQTLTSTVPGQAPGRIGKK